MSNQLNGILCRGVLLGYTKVPDNYKDKTTQQMVMRDAHLLGVERDSIGRFGEARKVTVQLHIPDELMKHKDFLDDISICQGRIVEIPLSGYSDFYNRLYLTNDARIFEAAE